jgi:hypothetical protein
LEWTKRSKEIWMIASRPNLKSQIENPKSYVVHDL